MLCKICNECDKNNVCKYKESAILAEEKLKDAVTQIDTFIFSYSINCRYRSQVKPDFLYRDIEIASHQKI